jgi:succinoglycan biosynthesis transport protein ExoP
MQIHLTPESRNRALNSPSRDWPMAAASEGAGDWSLAQCAQALYRRKKLVAAITGFGILIAALVSLLQPFRYQSQASLELQGVNENYLDFRAIYPNTPPATDADGSYLQTQAEILQGDPLIEQVVRRLNLQTRPEFQNHGGWFHHHRAAGADQAASLESVTDAVKKNLEVTFTHGSRILRITAQSRNPQLAADLANELAAVYIEQNVKQRQQAARQTYDALKGQLSEIRDRLNRSQGRSEASAAPGGALRSQVDADRRFYAVAAERANEAALASSIPQSNIRLVSPAQPAARPFEPNVPLNFAIGIFGGLVLAAGWVLLREQTNSALRAPGEAGIYLPVPELGAIPEADQNLRLGRFRNPEGAPAVERAALEQRFSRVSEAFRATLASILAAGAGTDPAHVLVATSAQPMEGKTTVLSNLGIALAEISNRVLLVDGDMRRPRLHKIFDQPNSWGLSDVLREKNAIEELPVEALVKKTGVPHLYLLPSGASADNVFSLLYSGRLERLLPRFRQEFDYVLIDAPPCLEFADARIMARYAERLLLVIRADYTGRQMVQAAVRTLLLDGISVMGVILNRWDPACSGGYGYRYQGALARQEAR